MAPIQNEYRTSSRPAVILPTNCLAQPGLGRNVPPNWCGDAARLVSGKWQECADGVEKADELVSNT
jgi:hypothetical protein